MTLERAIERASFEELKHILAWLDQRNAASAGPPGVLVGGWAVYAYNPYLGSIDIDLVTTGNMRRSLVHWLCETRGFARHKTMEVGWSGAIKKTPAGDVIADFGSRDEEYPFEGSKERLDFSALDGRTVRADVDGLVVRVPERTLLVLFKLKAAHDRGARILESRSDRPEWEIGKRVKDLSDVLALLDPDAGGGKFDLTYFAREIARVPFLVEQIEAAGTSADAVARYGRMPAKVALDRMHEVRELAGLPCKTRHKR